jgi:integrase
MAQIKIRGVKAYTSKGKVYAYHRASGTRINARYASLEFFAELAAIEEKHKADITPGAFSRPGTWGALVTLYRAAPKFLHDLKPRTRRDYNKVLDWLSSLHEMPLDDWSRGFVVRLRDKAQRKKGRRFANYVLSVVSAVFSWAFEREEVDFHPAQKIKKIRRPRDMPRANRPWLNAEWDVVVKDAPPHLLAPILLCGVLGWREGEAITRPRSDYDRTNKCIQRISSKSGKFVKTPVPPFIAAALEALFPHNATTLLVNSRKKPWTEDGFRTSFFKLVRKLERNGKIAKGLTMHGLRHTVATRMREQGFDLRTIADLLGQETEGMAGHYARQADLEQKMANVLAQMDKRFGEKR